MVDANGGSTVDQCLRATSASAQTGNRPFLFDAHSGDAWTYAEIDRLSDGVAHALVEAGVRPGDRVGALLPNGPPLVQLFLGTLKVGAVFNPVNPAFTAGEVAYIFGHSRPRLVCTSTALAPKLAKLPALPITLVDGAASGWFSARGSPARSALLPDTPALLLYTSGSTGRPKGALLTHDNLVTNAREIAAWLHVGPSDRMLCIMPLVHANALVIGITTPLVAGASTIVCERFSASGFWPTVDRFQPTMFGSVATILSRLLARGAPDPELTRTSVRFALCGSAPVPVETIRRFRDVFGIPVIEGYGLTECTCRATFNPVDAPEPGSAGMAIGNELRIVSETGADCPAHTIGEVVLRGRNIMAGYFNAPEVTRIALDGGWLHTGDLGYVTESGFLYLVGRKSDMIIRGGENVYPREIEDVLYRLRDVREAAVIGLPDPDYGERVVACLAGNQGMELEADTVIAHCRAHLATFKCPTSVHILDELPKGPTGKLLKSALRARFTLIP
jgi:long-chain acyl-CoA synthetase